jgi:hypothetical protein
VVGLDVEGRHYFLVYDMSRWVGREKDLYITRTKVVYNLYL